MAREEHDRENLLRDATAFVERIELAPATSAALSAEPIFIGFRASGAVSIYFSANHVYHFNSRRELRRAFCDGLLFKAEAGHIVSLERSRQADEVQLRRRLLSDHQANAMLADIGRRLQALQQDCARSALSIAGQVPPDKDVLGQVAAWLADFGVVEVACTANAH